MENSKNQIMKEARLTLKDQALHWERGTLLLPQISRIWAGRPPKEMEPSLLLALLLLVTAAGAILPNAIAAGVVSLAAVIGAGVWLIAAKRKNAINIELSSGVTCSFLVNQEAFAAQVCRRIVEYAAGKQTLEVIVIRLDGEEEMPEETGEIGETQRKVPLPETVSEYKREIAPTSLTTLDLTKLYENEKEKETPDQALLTLIEETIPVVEAGDRQESKIKFAKFIKAGLIQECNELGLNSLIKDIKSSLY